MVHRGITRRRERGGEGEPRQQDSLLFPVLPTLHNREAPHVSTVLFESYLRFAWGKKEFTEKKKKI